MSQRLHLFDAYGIELEYMIVDKSTLAVKPISDELLKRVTGIYTGDFENGLVTWSNELVLHVIELKCTQPEADLIQLEKGFSENVRRVNELLAGWNAMLLPSAAHPFMNPYAETKLWPHDNNEVYKIYDTIFDCKGHGWSNLQSMHINLPFSGDEEFARLHTAIRIVLPLLPALCASSPYLDGATTGYADSRLTFYKSNQAKIPSITGDVIPEPVFSEAEHKRVILDRIEKDIAPYNVDDVLDPVWVNSRGAMSRFDRGSIEIRVMDIQECPAADLAIATLVIATLKALIKETWSSFSEQRKVPSEHLTPLLEASIKSGHRTLIENKTLLQLFGESKDMTAQALWQKIAARLGREALGTYQETIAFILDHGTLSHRILKATNSSSSPEKIRDVYFQLSNCLANNRLFKPS